MPSATGDASRRGEHPGRRLARRADDRGRERNAKFGVEDDAHRRALQHAGQPAGQVRIVGQHRADADQDGVALRAHLVDTGARRFAGDAGGLAPGKTGLAVGGHRKLEQHLRAALAHPAEVAGVGPRRLLGAEAAFDRDAALAKLGVALPCHRRVGVLQRRDDTRNAGRMMASTQGGVLP